MSVLYTFVVARIVLLVNFLYIYIYIYISSVVHCTTESHFRCIMFFAPPLVQEKYVSAIQIGEGYFWKFKMSIGTNSNYGGTNSNSHILGL